MFKNNYQHTFSQVRPIREFDPEEIYMKATPKHTPFRRIVTIAVAAALILALSVTAYATELFGLMDFIMPKKSEDSVSQLISISGLSNSPEAKANAEWTEYFNSYDMNFIQYADDLPQNAGYYGAYNDEMYGKLKEIAAKYNLELLDSIEMLTPENPAPEHVKAGCSGAKVGYMYSNGSFKVEGNLITTDGREHPYTLMRNVKGSLTAASLNIHNVESWSQWNYTSPEGYQIVLGIPVDSTDERTMQPVGNRGLILSDLGNCFVFVLITDTMEGPVTADILTTVAESLDYAKLATVE